MILDIVFAIIVIAAFYNGYSKGIVYSVLSFFAIILGIVIAMNFSSIAAIWLHQNFNIPAVIMPALSFILVLVSVIAAVKLMAFITEKFLQIIMLNFVNKLAGGILWTVISTLIFSILVYLIAKTGILSPSLIESSNSYKYIVPLGPFALTTLQNIIPYLQDSFQLLNNTVQEIGPIN